MPKKCCIDSCVWIKYAGHFKTSTLLRYITENNLLVYADNYLLAEIHEALIAGFNFTRAEADKIIQLISPFIIIEAPRNIFRLAKDTQAPFIRKIDSWLKKGNK
jgi:hypothetical protein